MRKTQNLNTPLWEQQGHEHFTTNGVDALPVVFRGSVVRNGTTPVDIYTCGRIVIVRYSSGRLGRYLYLASDTPNIVVLQNPARIRVLHVIQELRTKMEESWERRFK